MSLYWLVGLLTSPAAFAGPLNVDDPNGLIEEGSDVEVFEIVNGVKTTDFDNVVSLVVDSGGFMSTWCSGTLIHPEWVLTAGHCVDSGVDGQIAMGTPLVVFGSNVNTGAIDRTVEMLEWFPHPSWTGDLQIGNDIGLVHLAEAVTAVDPSVLNDEVPDYTWEGQMLTFVGFGITTDMGQDAGVKRTTDIPIQSVNEQFIESYDPLTNVCSGDSGGAAFEDTADGLELAGVNSYVTPGCEGGANGVTNVATFVDWIKTHVPDILTEKPEPELPGGGAGGDLSLSPPGDIDGLGPRWVTVRGEGATVGCQTTPGGASWWALLVIAPLVRRRR
jgi:uncharacterized protein (TIGR03382 family)